MNVALISPAKNAYSETFIQAHKKFLPFNIFYYHNGYLPTSAENIDFPISNFSQRLLRFFKKKSSLKNYSYSEIFLIESFKQNKINCVLAEYGPCGSALLPICKKLNIPLIVIFHGYDATQKSILKEYREKYNELFKHANSIIAVSNCMKEKLIKLGCLSNKIFVSPCAPDNEFLSIKPTYEEKIIIGIGRFVDKKAPYYTILAFKKVLKEIPDAKLIIAGDGPLHNTCKNIIRYENLEKNIILEGVISPEKFLNYLSKARAFIQHSITAENGDMEGTPVSVMEASAAGLPVISTLSAGIPEVIIHNKTGLLVEEHDVDNMAKNIVKLLKDKKVAIEYGEEGKKNIKNNFSMKHHIKIISDLINNSV